MAERKSAFDNIREDFSFLLDPSSYDLPDWLQFGIGDNEYVPEATPPTPMTPEQRRRAEQEARRAQILAADAGLGSPPAMTMAPEMGVAPLDGVSGMGLTGGDMPVQVAPYGVTPELGGPQGADAIEAAIADLQSADRTRTAGVDPLTGGDARAAATAAALEDIGGAELPPGYNALPGVLEGETPTPGPIDRMLAGATEIDIPWDAVGGFVDDAVGTFAPGQKPVATIRGLLNPEVPGQDTLPTVGDTPPVVSDGPLPSNFYNSPRAGIGGDKKSPPVEVGGGTGSTGKPAGAGTAAVPVDETPVKENPLNALQQFTQDKFGWDEDKRGDMSEALMSAGFAMMAGDSPDWAQNVGKGGLVGIEAYQGAKDQRRAEGLEDDAMAMREQLHEMRMAEGRRAAEKHGIEVKKLQKAAEAGVDPLSLLTGSAKSKAQAAVLFKNGIIDEDTYNSILGIDDDGSEGI